MPDLITFPLETYFVSWRLFKEHRERYSLCLSQICLSGKIEWWAWNPSVRDRDETFGFTNIGIPYEWCPDCRVSVFCNDCPHSLRDLITRYGNLVT